MIRFGYVIVGEIKKPTKSTTPNRFGRTVGRIKTETRFKLIRGGSAEYWTMEEILIQ